MAPICMSTMFCVAAVFDALLTASIWQLPCSLQVNLQNRKSRLHAFVIRELKRQAVYLPSPGRLPSEAPEDIARDPAAHEQSEQVPASAINDPETKMPSAAGLIPPQSAARASKFAPKPLYADLQQAAVRVCQVHVELIYVSPNRPLLDMRFTLTLNAGCGNPQCD